MRSLHIPVLVIALLLFSFTASAQWHASAELTGGRGGMANKSSDDGILGHSYITGTIAFGHDAPKFQWNTSLDCQYEPKESEVSKGTFTGIHSDHVKLDGIVRLSDQHPLNARWRTEATFTPAAVKRYSTWVQYSYRSNYTENSAADIGAPVDDDTGEIDFSKLKLSEENQQLREQKAEAGFSSRHQLGSPRRMLFSEITAAVSDLDQSSLWEILDMSGKDTGGPAINHLIYRINTASTIPSLTASLHMRDSLFTGATRFTIDPGVRFVTGTTLNRHSGATNTGGEDKWRDSLRLRESFNFLELRVEPYLAGELRREKLRFNFDYALQMYAKRLNDDTHRQQLAFQLPHPTGSSTLEWQPAPDHRLTLGNSLAIQYPAYRQICWYDRPGEYANQLVRGNTGLLPTGTVTMRAGYDYKHRRFSTSLAASVARKTDEIDRTFFDETIAGKTYKVFTWVNAADSWTGSASAKITWSGSKFVAGASADYRQTLRIKRGTKEEKRSFDWNFKTNAAWDFAKGWRISADMMFQSKVATFFTMFGQYCTLNASISKTVGKLTIFLSGKDLLDTVQTVEFTSEDGNSYWQEEALNNRRLILLGARWRL